MDNEHSKIEELKKSLYSRISNPNQSKKKHLRTQENDVPDDWSHETQEREPAEPNGPLHEGGSTFFHKILIGSLIFFLIALGVGAFILWRGSNIVSANNVDITIAGPASVAGGEVISLDVQVRNGNKVPLTGVDMSVDFPSGTADPLDTTKELQRFHQTMKDINPGAEETKTIKAVLYGEENTKKEINVEVEYHVPGSDAVFYKKKTYEIFINSSPVTLAVSSFNEITSGQQFEITALVTSNSKETLKNILVKADYPFGFSFVSASPKPLSDNKTWNLGSLSPHEKRTIKITGKLEGQDNEERVFKFAIGTQSSRINNAIGTQFVTAANSVNLRKPFITTGLSLNGGTGDMVGHPGEVVNAVVNWSNNLPTNIVNAEIKVLLSGSAFDKTKVSAQRGFFNSSDNSIVWDQKSAGELASIGAEQQGSFNFSFTPSVPTGLVDPYMNIDVSVKATRLSEKNVPEQILSSIHRVVRISPNIDLAGQVLRTSGPFVNTGPLPPQADKPTTYTIVWTVSNTSSTISNAEVNASLPSYVKWLGKVSPTSEVITYDPTSGRLIWKIGSLPAYTGITSARKEVAFQVEFDPSVSQVGQSPVLVNEATLRAQDQFSKATHIATKQALTTRFSTDPSYKAGDENVRN